MKHCVFCHAGNCLNGWSYIHPYRLAAQQDIHYLFIGLVDLLFYRHCSFALLIHLV